MKIKKDAVDSYLIAVCIALLAGFFFIFQTRIDVEVMKWTLLASFVLYTASLLLLVWHQYRFPKREAYFETKRKETTKKFADRIFNFMENLAGPLAYFRTRVEIVEKIEKARTAEERQKILDDLRDEKNNNGKKGLSDKELAAVREVTESVVLHMDSEVKKNYREAFRKPLGETYSKPKFYIDIIAHRIRRHVFASASVLLFFSFIIKFLVG